MPQRADDLSLLQAQMVYKKRLETVLKELRSQESALSRKVADLEQRLRHEQRDLDRLEGLSLAAFFYNMTGQLEEKLEKERQETSAARVKYSAALRELEAIQADLTETEIDLQDLADCEERYARSLEQKRLEIETAGSNEARELLDMEEALALLAGQERELDEAISAGTDALHAADEVMQNLSAARDWGAFDALCGGLLPDLAKHDKIDEAQQSIEQLQIRLQRFNKELTDTDIRTDLEVSISRMLKFSDIFFDNLLTDLAVLDRITQAQRQVDQTRDQILGILRQLQTKKESVHHKHIQAKTGLEERVLTMALAETEVTP